MVRQYAGQRKRHFGIVGRLAGNRVPSASVGKFTDAFRVFPPDVIRSPKLDQTAKRVSGKLAEKTALGAIHHPCITLFVDCVTRLSHVIVYPFGGYGSLLNIERVGILEKEVKEIGADRALYGSDLTINEPAAVIARVRNAFLTEEDREKILFRNVERLPRKAG